MERKRGIQIKEGDRINRWTVIKEVESESGSSNFEDKRFLCRCDCIDCKLYEGFGQRFEHGYNLVENCKDYKKRE